MQTLWIKLFASFAPLALLIMHLMWSQVRIDTTAIYLLVIGIVTWLASMFDTFEMPGGWKVTFRTLQDKQERQQGGIATLQFLLSHFLTESELIHLTKLASKNPFPFQNSPYFATELRHLRALGFIAGLPGCGIRTLFSGSDGDVHNHLRSPNEGGNISLSVDRQSLNLGYLMMPL